jgi:O-antigen/teichoic acid export membrane protein
MTSRGAIPVAVDAAASGALRRIARSGFPVYFAGNLLSAGLGLGLLLVLVRTLGPEGFGRVASLVNFLDIGMFLVDMALFSGVVQLAAKYAEGDPARSQMALKIAFFARLALAGAFALAGVVLAPAIARWLFESESDTGTLRLIFLTVMAGAVYSQAISTLLSRKRFNRLAATVLLKNGMRVLVVAGLLVAGLATPGSVAAGYGMAAVLAAAGSLMLCRFDFLAATGHAREIGRELFDVNKWAVVAAVGMLGVRIDLIMIQRLSLPAEVGYYAAATQLVIVVTLFSQSLANFVFPGIAALDGNADMRRHVLRVARLAPLAAVPIAILVPLAVWGVPLVLGPAYAGMQGALVMMLLSAALTLVFNPIGLLLFPLRRVDLLAKAAVLMILMRIVLNLLLIPSLGAFGAATSDLVTKIVVNGGLLVLIWSMLWRHGAGDGAQKT